MSYFDISVSLFGSVRALVRIHNLLSAPRLATCVYGKAAGKFALVIETAENKYEYELTARSNTFDFPHEVEPFCATLFEGGVEVARGYHEKARYLAERENKRLSAKPEVVLDRMGVEEAAESIAAAEEEMLAAEIVDSEGEAAKVEEPQENKQSADEKIPFVRGIEGIGFEGRVATFNYYDEHLKSTKTLSAEDIIERLKEDENFYQTVKPQFDELFARFPAVPYLEGLIENSSFCEIPYDTGKNYFVGLLRESGEVKYIAYGIRAKYGDEFANECFECAEFIPCNAEEPQGEGYYLKYQSAKSGKDI